MPASSRRDTPAAQVVRDGQVNLLLSESHFTGKEQGTEPSDVGSRAGTSAAVSDSGAKPNTARLPATQPKEFTSVADLISPVPANLRPLRAEDWTDLRMAAANKILSAQTVNRRARFRVKVRLAEITHGGDYDGYPRMLAEQPPDVKLPVVLWSYFPKAAVATAAELNPGDVVTVIGRIVKSEFSRDGKTVRLNVDLMDASYVR